MHKEGVLHCYERALSLTHAMLDAARKSDWDGLVKLEGERGRLIDQIRRDDPDPGRDAAGAPRKREIITEMLQLDEQVQLLTQDWMHELRDVLGSIGNAQRLARTYGP